MFIYVIQVFSTFQFVAKSWIDRFLFVKNIPRVGVCLDRPHPTFKPLNSMFLLPNRLKSVTKLLAYLFLVKSSFQFVRGVHTPHGGVSQSPRSGVRHSPHSGVSRGPLSGLSHTPCAGYGAGGSWFGWSRVGLDPRSVLCSLVKRMSRSFGFKVIIVSFCLLGSMSYPN